MENLSIYVKKSERVLASHVTAISLKLLCKTLLFSKMFDKTNMKVFALSIWKKSVGAKLILMSLHTLEQG